MKTYKFVSSRLVLGLTAVFLAVIMAGCAATAPHLDDTAASVATTTATADTSPTETEAETATKSSEETQGMTAATTEATSAPSVNQTEATQEAAPATESKAQAADSGNSATTQATSPPETEPPETEPPHVHSYSATSTVAPGCECDGYTVYECSCGSGYTDDYVSAIGHSWGEWTTIREPTSSVEGEKARTCSGCGATETASIEKLPAEQIDTAALEAYGRQYAANTYGYDPVVGTRAGYYPGALVTIDSMSKGYSKVEECIEATTDQLVSAGVQIVAVIDGKECAAMIDIEVVHESGNDYRVWVYYG